MSNEEPSRESIALELNELKQEAKKYSVADLKRGVWFPQLLRHALESYAKTVDADYFRNKYSGLNVDAIVDRRIELAKRYAALAGGLSATGYSAAVIATLGTKGGASPLTVPAAITAFAADLFFISRLQLRLAYDLSILYGHPIDLDDPEDLIDLVKVAFGVKAGEELQNAMAKLTPEAVRQGVKYTIRGPVLHALKALPVVGKYLLQRNIIKMAIPGVAIPLSAGLNYYLTGRIATVARQVFRDKAYIQESAADLVAGLVEDPVLLLQVAWLVAKSDGKTSAEESWLINAIAEELLNSDSGAESVAEFTSMVDFDEADVLERLARASYGSKRQIYRACCVVAAADHKFHKKEKKLLERIAEVCGIDYDPAAVDTIIARTTL